LYAVVLPESEDVHVFYNKLKEIEEENPELNVMWNKKKDEIHIRVMGEVQTEILKSLILERFDLEVAFKASSVVYKETIEEAVFGVGHFEPLRHYAEVHILLEPLPRGSGIQYANECSEDILDKNYQKIILTHLKEKKHLGVLTGSNITDIKMTLLTGRANKNHTMGGDFREATYRAVRQGLRKAKSILLEPYYEFRLELQMDKVGRAMSDISAMSGNFQEPIIKEDRAILTGKAPVTSMQNYQSEVTSYTGGTGKLALRLAGYDICHNTEEIIEALAYDVDADVVNSTGSMFCIKGAGTLVAWDEVETYMHVTHSFAENEKKSINDRLGIESEMRAFTTTEENDLREGDSLRKGSVSKNIQDSYADEKELNAIFERTYGEIKRPEFNGKKNIDAPKSAEKEYIYKGTKQLDEYLIVDGYNIIYQWEELAELAKTDFGAARDSLCDTLSNYQGYKKCTLILVFDAYKLKEHKGEEVAYHGIKVVYTKTDETADQYIERLVNEIGKKYRVTVATSDQAEQRLVLGLGALRMSARELKLEIVGTEQEIRDKYL
jgi:predicted RNA-binding protein with PIN domain